ALGYGFYLASSKDVARGYTKGYVPIMGLFLKSKKPIDFDSGNLSKQELRKLINKIVDSDIHGGNIKDYRDSFLSNYIDTYSTTRDRAINEVVEILSDGNDKAVDQISELSNVVGSKEIVN